MKTKVEEIRKAIENKGGLKSFASETRRNRPVGCPMKRMMSKELQELSNEELHVAFSLGLIGNNNRKGSIVENSKNTNDLDIDVSKGSGIRNNRTGKIEGFNCDIDFNCTCGWHSSAWGEFSKGSYSKTCPHCGAKKTYNV